MKRSVAVIYHTQKSCTVDEDMQQNIVTGLESLKSVLVH